MKTFTIDINGWHSECEAPNKVEALNVFMQKRKRSIQFYNWLLGLFAKHILEKK